MICILSEKISANIIQPVVVNISYYQKEDFNKITYQCLDSTSHFKKKIEMNLIVGAPLIWIINFGRRSWWLYGCYTLVGKNSDCIIKSAEECGELDWDLGNTQTRLVPLIS